MYFRLLGTLKFRLDGDLVDLGGLRQQRVLAMLLLDANKVVSAMGIERKGLVEAPLEGYNPPFLDGIWARAPYLHNGSVPSLRELLKPPPDRLKVFWRGCDLYDKDNVGFITECEEAKRIGTRFDTSERANGNGGHVFGVDLPKGDKDALLEYMKTL